MSPLAARLQAASRVLAGLAGAIAALELARRLLAPGPAAAPFRAAMGPGTAAALLACAAALALLQPEAGLWRRRLGRSCAAAAVLMAAAAVAGHLVGDEGARTMAPLTAPALVLAGAALLLLDRELPAGRWPAQGVALAVVCVGLIGMIGYAYGVPIFHGPDALKPMALGSALCLTLLGLGTLAARPGRGLTALLVDPGIAGTVVRRLLPVVCLVPPLLGWLRLEGERAGLYAGEVGVEIVVLLTMLLLGAVVWFTSRALSRTEAERQQAQSELAGREALYRTVLSQFPDGSIVLFDHDLRFVLAEGQALERVGLSKAQMEGRTVAEVLPPDFAEARTPTFRAALAGEDSVQELDYGGRRFLSHLRPLRDEAGRVVAGMAMSIDITERTRAEEEIRRLNRDLERSVAELKASNDELEAFSYSVSHDLRAPLRHIHGFVDLLRRGARDRLDETAQRHLETIARAARRMGELIDDLLAFSRVSRTAVLKQPVSLGFLVREVVQPFEAEPSAAPVEWRIGDLPEVEADPALLRIVLDNLVANAVKYSSTRPRPLVEIGAGGDDGEVVVSVRDNGVGFDMQYAGKLFGVFQRLHRADEFEGTGIGLATVRRIINRHGGRTWAEGRLGEGATFYFSLPRTEARGERSRT